MSERWFVLAHEATNSGAPRMLLRVLQAVKARRGDAWTCEIVLRYGGPLTKEFAALGNVRVLASRGAHGRTLRAGLIRRFVDRPWLQPRRLARILTEQQGERFDLVYCNTATNGFLVSDARRLGCPVLTHVHELGFSLRRFNSPAELAATLQSSDRFLAVSPPVATDLIECGVAADTIAIVPNFLAELPAAAGAAQRSEARRALGISADARVIVGCGHIDRVKGTDLFVELAAMLARRVPAQWEFVWLGEETDVAFARQLREQRRRQKGGPVVRFVGQVVNPTGWFTAADVVAVTSRAESFSLVALEAAALGRPVVGFSGSRGLGFVLGETDELLAPEFDLGGLAVRVERLLANPAEAQRIGGGLRERVAAEFMAPRQVDHILRVTDALRSQRRGRS